MAIDLAALRGDLEQASIVWIAGSNMASYVRCAPEALLTLLDIVEAAIAAEPWPRVLAAFDVAGLPYRYCVHCYGGTRLPDVEPAHHSTCSGVRLAALLARLAAPVEGSVE